MADGILIPPWLKGVDPGELARLHATGMEIGQRAAAQQNAALMAMREAQAREAEASARQAEAQQRIDLEVQRQQAQVQQAAQEIAVKQAAEERQARKAAMQFAGQKQYQDIFDQAIAGGATPEEAGRKAFLGSANLFMGGAPAATATAIGRFAAPRKPPSTPFTPTTGTVKNPITGQDIPYMTTGMGSAKELKAGDEEFNKRKAAQILAPRIRSIYSDINRERKNQIGSKPGKKAYDLAQEEIDRLQKEAKEITSEYDKLLGNKGSETAAPIKPPATDTGIRIRSKKTGKTMRYKGRREDIPLDEYDILE